MTRETLALIRDALLALLCLWAVVVAASVTLR